MKEKPTMRRKIRLLDTEKRKKVKRQLGEYVGKSGLWPLNAPGMPPPGPNFLRQAMALGDKTEYVKGTKTKPGVFKPGDQLEELYRRALREVGFTLSVEIKKGRREEVTFVPGHIWGQYAEEWQKSMVDPTYTPPPVDGPHPASVMVLGKMPWRDETSEGRNLIGPTGEILTDLIKKLHIKGASKWYVTNLCKFMPPEECGSKLLAGWIHDCLPLLHQELRLVRPDYIVCLGADASKWLLGDKYNVSYMAGRVVPYKYQVQMYDEDDPEHHTAHVMTVLHPAEVSRSPEKIRILQSNFGRFAFLITGQNFDLEEKGLDHRVCDTYEDAVDWVEEVNTLMRDWKRKDKLIAWDAEWQGQHPMNEGSYLRTVQVSWGEKKAICFKITHAGGKLAFRDREGKPAMKRLAKLLNTFMEDKRAVGHFFVSDLEWLNYYGIDPIASCHVPLEDKGGKLAWERLRAGVGWIDTAYMNHAIEETAPLGLEMLAMRYTTAPRYDIPLEDWKKAYCTSHKISSNGLEGYGECPDEILVPYANYDSDVTLRIAKQLMPLLDCDYEGNNCWEPFWESMIIQKVILRIHKNGILVDRSRIDELTKKFLTARYAKEEEIRQWAKWPEFNIRSTQQVREFLFGTALNGKRDDFNTPIRLRPKDARSLHITPLLDTSKPPRRWKDLEQRGLADDATPGTGKMILGILAEDNLNVADQIGWVRDYRFLDQVLKSILRPPLTDENDKFIENDEGFLEYDAGLAHSIDSDGRVRTHLYPTAETGRWKSSRPNLQNISKSRDPDYERLLGKDAEGKSLYRNKLRSVLKAEEGFALIEFDYKGAELYGMSIMAGSQAMMDHCQRANTFDEDGYSIKGKLATKGHGCPGKCKKCKKDDKLKGVPHPCGGGCELCGYPHPEYYDIHSNVAKLAFQLQCHASKFGLDQIGKSHFRTLAKNVIFGIAYGRGAKAIALQAKEQKVNVTPEQAQTVIDAIFNMYPELVPFFEDAKHRALNEKWLCHCFGRFRRFPTTSDFKLEGEFERQAMNFPIQGMIASAVDRGLAWLDYEIDRQGLSDDIRLLLQIHDAGLVECRYHLVPYAKQLIQWAMCDKVEIWPTNLAGKPRGDGPYRLGLDFAVEQQWGEKIPKDEYAKLGILA